MARLWSSGFELSSLTDGVEMSDASFLGGGGVVSIDTNRYRSGSYSQKVANAGADGTARGRYLFSATVTDGPYYLRAYIYIADAPAANSTILYFQDASTAKGRLSLSVSTMQLRLFDDTTQIGSNSSTLSLNTWYMCELYYFNNTVSGLLELEARLNGVSFASGTSSNVGGVASATVGVLTSTSSYEIYYDDVAVNDSSGSFQNSWPGEGGIIHLRPNAAGDNAAWTIDGTTAEATNFQSVADEQFDSNVTFVRSTTANQTDDHLLGPVDAHMVQPMGASAAGFGEFTNTRYRGQTFTALTDTISSIKLHLDGTGSRDLKIYLYAADSSDLPTGSELTSWVIPNASLTTSYTEYALTPYTSLTPGTKYAIYFAPWDSSGGGAYADDYRDLKHKNANIYAGGAAIVNTNGTWAVSDSGNLELKCEIKGGTVVASDVVINCVQVGGRFGANNTSNVPGFVYRIKATSGGTVEESAEIVPTSTSYVTNAVGTVKNYPLTLYDLPGASTTAWTKADLATAQIGYRISTDSTNIVRQTGVWLLVDYKAGAGGGGGGSAPNWPILSRNKFWGPRFA